MYRIHTNVWYACSRIILYDLIGFCVVRYENLTDLFPFFLFHVLNKNIAYNILYVV